MKKLYKAILIALIFTLTMSNLANNAFANSAAPREGDRGSGILFDQNENIAIQSEVLDIVMRHSTAEITATYIMKNLTEEDLSVNMMFLSHVNYYDVSPRERDKDFIITKNGVELDYKEEYFSSNVNKHSIENWEAILADVIEPTTPFGEVGGYKEYKIINPSIDYYLDFSPSDFYFVFGWGYYGVLSNETVKMGRPHENYNLIVSRDEPNFHPDLNVEINEIDDIYTYLFERGQYNDDYEYKFLEESFNEYLAGIEENEQNIARNFLINFYYYDMWDEAVSAISYTVDFNAEESVELMVSYVYNLGGRDSYATLLYYLTPAKYWQDFSDLTINLYLSEAHPVIKSSSLDFIKIDKLTYQFKSNTLPDTELKIHVGQRAYRDFFDFITSIYGIITILIIAIPLCIIGAIVIIAIKLNKRKLRRAIKRASMMKP